MGNTQSFTAYPAFTTTFPQGVTWEMMEPIMSRKNQANSQTIANHLATAADVNSGNTETQAQQEQKKKETPQATATCNLRRSPRRTNKSSQDQDQQAGTTKQTGKSTVNQQSKLQQAATLEGTTINPPRRNTRKKRPVFPRNDLKLKKRVPTEEEKRECEYAQGLAELCDGKPNTLVNIHPYNSTKYHDAKWPHFDFDYVLCHICGENPTYAMVPHMSDYVPIKSRLYQDPDSNQLTPEEKRQRASRRVKYGKGCPPVTLEERVARQESNRRHAQKTLDLFNKINKVKYRYESKSGRIVLPTNSVPDSQLALAKRLFQEYNNDPTTTNTLTGDFISTTSSTDIHAVITCAEHNTFPLFFLALFQDLLDHLSLAYNYPDCLEKYTDSGWGNPKIYVSKLLLTHVAFEQMIACFFLKIRTKHNNTQHTDLPLSEYLGCEPSKPLSKEVPMSVKTAIADAGDQCTARISFQMHFFNTYFSTKGFDINVSDNENYRTGRFQNFLLEANTKRNDNKKKFHRGILSTYHLIKEHYGDDANLQLTISEHQKSLTLHQWTTALKYKKEYIQVHESLHFVSEEEKENDDTYKQLLAIIDDQKLKEEQAIILNKKLRRTRANIKNSDANPKPTKLAKTEPTTHEHISVTNITAETTTENMIAASVSDETAADETNEENVDASSATDETTGNNKYWVTI